MRRENNLTALIIVLLVAGTMLLCGLSYDFSLAKSTESACSLQESKPILLITLKGLGAGVMCEKIIDKSNGRYFAFYGQPSQHYQAMCVVSIHSIHYTVYDSVPGGGSPAMRYSMQKVCPLLQNNHRLIGQGF